jgi:hypothetical protein
VQPVILSRPKFGFSPAANEAFLQGLLNFPPVAPGNLIESLPDQSDIAFAEVALAAPELLLVTGNRKHFIAAERFGLVVINPATALRMLG